MSGPEQDADVHSEQDKECYACEVAKLHDIDPNLINTFPDENGNIHRHVYTCVCGPNKDTDRF